MSDTVVLRGVPVELASDLGHAFVVDCTRAAEGLLTDKELSEIYEILPADWQNIAKDAALARAIRAERDRRVRSGVAAREAASKHFVKAPGVLDQIMMDAQANPRHKIEAIRELRQTAIPENQNTAGAGDRFVISINLGGGHVETYDEARAIDVAPDQPKLAKTPKLIVDNDEKSDE